MSITTYDELKASVTSWLKRDELTEQSEDFITLAEAYFNRVIRSTEMETRTTLSASSEFTSLPSDYLGLRSIHITGSPDTELKYVTPQQLTQTERNEDTGTPFLYTIIDQELQLYPAPTSSTDVDIVYLQKIPALTASNTTNWLLTDHPDIYLYASLAQAEGFLYNDNRIAVWDGQAHRAIATLNNNANKRRVGTGPLEPRVSNAV